MSKSGGWSWTGKQVGCASCGRDVPLQVSGVGTFKAVCQYCGVESYAKVGTAAAQKMRDLVGEGEGIAVSVGNHKKIVKE